MRGIAGIVAAVAVAASLGLSACDHGSSGPSVTACTKDIVAHPKNGPWPHCKGLTHKQLEQATANAMAQGAVG